MKIKQNNYKFDLVHALLVIGACGLAGFGIIHSFQGISLFLMFIGLPIPMSLIAAGIILISAGIVLGLKKKDDL